jgi:hemerythrin superfamily protein
MSARGQHAICMAGKLANCAYCAGFGGLANTLQPSSRLSHQEYGMATARKKTASKKSSGRKTASKGTSSRSKDALALLRADHDAVIALFKKFEKSKNDEQKQQLADQICKELTVHTQIEEEIFYPAIREAQPVKDADDILDEADVEHDGAKKLIEEIESSGVGAEKFDAMLKVLSEYIKHHVKEEYDSIFPAAKKAKLDLQAMGEELANRKQELMAGG